MNLERRHVLSSLLAAVPALVLAHPVGSDPAHFVTQALTVGGRVQRRLSLSPEALSGFAMQAPTEIPVIGRTGEVLRIMRGYAGAKLTDVLDSSGLAATDHHDLRKTVVIATASDGYQVIFSWNELYNTPVGGGVLVLYGQGGQSLDEREGRIALISIKDAHTGPRHVRWLQDVQVQQIG